MMRGIKSLAMALLVAGSWSLAGCEKKSNISYEQPPSLDQFDKGADRPPTARTLFSMAKMLAAQGKVAEADAVLMATVNRFPDFLPGYTELAASQIRQGNHEGAAIVLEEGLAHAPNDPVLLNDLGMCYMLQEEYAMASEQFVKAVAVAPSDARYQANQALSVGMQGRYEESLEIYGKILRPDRAHYNLAVICEARDDHERAAHEFLMAEQLANEIDRGRK